MVWQPTMRVWAGDEVKIDAKELEDGDGHSQPILDGVLGGRYGERGLLAESESKPLEL